MSTAAAALRRISINNEGATRHVILAGRFAIKVPALWSWKLFLCGLLANMQEASLSAANLPGLCPVVWSIPGGWMVVMRRARVLTDDEFLAFDVEAFCERPDYSIPAEHKANSFGWYSEKIVAIDYGT